MIGSNRGTVAGLVVVGLLAAGCGGSAPGPADPGVRERTDGASRPAPIGAPGSQDASRSEPAQEAATATSQAPVESEESALRRGARLVVEGRLEDALRAYDQVLRSNPRSVTGTMAKAQTLLEDFPGHDPRAALDLFSRVEDRQPTAKVFIADAHLEMGNVDLADAAMTAFFDAAPADLGQRWPLVLAHAQVVKSALLMAQKETEAVPELLDSATRLLDDAAKGPAARDLFVVRWMGKLRTRTFYLGVESSLARGETEEARARAAQRADDLKGEPRYHDLMARVYTAEGDGEQAGKEQRIATLLIETTRASRDVTTDLDKMEASVGELDGLLGGYPRGTILLARACLQRGEWDRAIAACTDLRRRVEADPDSHKVAAESWFVQGMAHYQKHEGKEAIAAYAQAARLEPSFQARYQELRRQIEALMEREAGGSPR